MKQQLALSAAALAIVAAASSAAVAGYKGSHQTAIYHYTGWSMATGALGATRNSADGTQYLGCELIANKDYSYMQCWARDAGGKYLTCYNRVNQGMKDAVAAIADGSYLSFQTDPADPSKCGFVQVTTASYHEVPVP